MNLSSLKTTILTTTVNVIELIPDAVGMVSDVVGVGALYSRRAYLDVYSVQNMYILRAYFQSKADVVNKCKVDFIIKMNEASDERELSDEEVTLLASKQADVDSHLPAALAWEKTTK